MKHRIFIAVNLPEDIKELLYKYQANHPDVPARWTARENLHVTVVFIGDVDDDKLAELHKTIKEIVKKHKTFTVRLSNIYYAPPKIIPPRMIWAVGETSKELSSLCDNLVGALAGLPVTTFKSENRENIVHITLARIKKWEWRRIEPEERPEVGENLDFSFGVKSIELMESILKRKGPEYKILESYKLK